MNKHTAYIGRNVLGERVFAQLELRDIRQDMTTVNHDQVSRGIQVSIVGLLVGKGARSVTGAGQIHSNLVDMDMAGSKWTTKDVASLRKIWTEWHLNDMNAGCQHMRKGGSYDDRKNDVCPESGYKYGTAWLYREPTSDVIREIKRLMSLPSGDVPNYI